MRKRPVLLASLAVFLAGAAGATVVFLVGSAQRREDRAAYLTYERALFTPLADASPVVQQEIKQSLSELGDASITTAEAEKRAAAWIQLLAGVRRQILGLTPPVFLGDMENRWGTTIEGYRRAADYFVVAARASESGRTSLVDQAQEALERADDLFERAGERMQFHRRRLGLGPTPRLPDPAAIRTP